MPFGIGAAISGVTGIITGSNASNAATKAAKIQADAAKAAGQQVIDTTAAVNPGITATADTAAADVNQAGDASAGGAINAAIGANARLDPYAAAGSTASEGLKAGVTAGGQFNSAPTLDQLQMDPGYAFRVQQQQLAIDRSAASRGGVTQGGNVKDQIDYAGGAASQEYQNAFTRFQTNRQNNFTDLMGVSNAGQTAATGQGANSVNAAQFAGDTELKRAQLAGGFTTGAANLTGANTINAANTAGNYAVGGAAATAAGIVGSSNAVGGGINNAANSVNSALLLKQVLKNPATQYNLSPTDLGWSASEAP